MRRVVVTGIGLVTALGIGTETTWRGLIEGRSGVGPIRRFDASSLRSKLGGELLDFEPEKFVASRRTLRMTTRNDQLALAGAALALGDAGLDPAELDAERAALFVGGNKEIGDPLHLLEASLVARNPDGTADLQRFGESAQSTAYPLFYVEALQGASLFYISQAYGLQGANAYFAGTAESGAVAVGSAYRAIHRGEADVALAGGFDDAVSWWSMTKLDGLEVLTDRNDLGAGACRPYDKDRSGTVLGEGSAFMTLEEYGIAARRGARMYAEVTGFGSGYDAYKILTPEPHGQGLGLAMQAALREAGSCPEAIGYVATHGSGTILGDLTEARAIRAVFGAAVDRLTASSVKPATGHLMAGAGALNVAIAALAIWHHIVPPTLNLERPDPTCNLDWVPGSARQISLEQALALARGLVGQSVALALRAVP
jgi:3-oxoacyl-[acyl-carrier-protein] synthase II